MKNKPILECRIEILDYTSDQQKALLLIEKFINQKINKYFLLIGNAGTGKTTIAENIANYGNTIMMAPTNAAVKRLADKFSSPKIKIERFKTIHQVLYGAPDQKTGKFTPKEGFEKGKSYIIDEASMIDKKMLDDLIEAAEFSNAKLIFIGDDFQLEPVGEDPELFTWENINSLFKEKWKIKLHEVKRTTGTILTIATHLRKSNTPKILKLDQPDFKIVGNFTSELPLQIDNDEDYIVLCSTNKKRVVYNNHIRKQRFKEESVNPVVDYERLISVANTRFLNGEIFTIKNHKIIEEYFEVINVGSRNYPKWSEYKMYLIQHEIEGHKELFKTLLIPDLDKPSLYPQMVMTSKRLNSNPRLTEAGIQNPKWRRWRKDISIATYGYATSTHKSQGSEWDNVYIDASWLSDKWNHSRWLYTAITRAKKNVELINSSYFKIVEE